MAQGMRTGMAVATALLASMALASRGEASSHVATISTQQPFLFNWVEAPSNTGGTLSAAAPVTVDISHHGVSTGWLPAFLTFDGVIPDGNPAAATPFAFVYLEKGMLAQMTLTYTGAAPFSFRGLTVSPGQTLIETSPPSSWNGSIEFLNAPTVQRVRVDWDSQLAYTSLYPNNTPHFFSEIIGIPLTTPSITPNQAFGSFSFNGEETMVLGVAPEPSSWAMLLTGVLGVGTAMRRRARAAIKPDRACCQR
jgi:hypothetical protein